jgi:hypothetical protein
MEFEARFHIDCGVSSGYALKSPDNVDRQETIIADGPEAAYKRAMAMATEFAEDYLSNPETGLTTVQLSSLRGPNGNVLFYAPGSIVQCSMLEHILALPSEIKASKSQ